MNLEYWLREVLPYLIMRLMRANKLKKFSVSLATARTDASLVAGGLIPSKTFMSLTILDKGTGTFSFKFRFTDDTVSEAFSQAEVLNGDVFDVEFKDLIWTNTAQTVTNPSLICSWREI